jgi:hypothetical protein
MPTYKITDTILPHVMRKWREGLTSDQIVEFLEAQYSVVVTPRAVRKRIQSMKNEELEARKDAIRRKASDEGLSYVDMMHQRICSLNGLADILLKSEVKSDVALGKQLAEIQLKYIDKKFELTGINNVDKTEELEDTIIIESIFAKLGIKSDE